MAKLSYENKIQLYKDKKSGITLSAICSKYNIKRSSVDYLVRLIDKHGYDILRTTKNKYYSIEEKQRIINRVLLNEEGILSISIDEGLCNSGLIHNWINKYKENGYNIVERKRGRSPMFKPKPTNKKEETQEEKIKRLESENLYLKAELEYSKKLRAVVQARKNLQQKKK